MALSAPTAANADGDGGSHDTVVLVTAEPLQGPRQLNDYRGHRLVVAESDSGEVSSVDPDGGKVEALITFGSPKAPASPQGVDYDDGRLFVALGEVGGPEDGPPLPVELPPEGTPVPRCIETSTAPRGPALVVAEPHGDIIRVCDLLQYELVVNPDGQTQVDEANLPVDSLSNPYSVLAQDERILVADAGANSVLSIDRRNGKISTFFVPPLVTDGACAGAENNSASDKHEATVGCHPVPTGVARGPDGRIYVSTLGALTPRAGRVYVLDSDGEEVGRIKGSTP
jgi:DNA-binding beta-propeller fold protein YncE